MTPPNEAAARSQLAILAACLVLGMTPWFSATVAAPAMIAEWHLPVASGPWFTMAVQLGFVAGTLVGSLFMLSDRWRAERFAGWSAVVAGIATILIAERVRSASGALVLRAVTGAALAGVYPPGIKLVAGWWRSRRGLAIGVLVGALTVGSASPHLISALAPNQNWRGVLLVSAGAAFAAAALFLFAVREGPYQAPSAAVSAAGLRRVVGDRGVLLATAGYLGHMWELYAMWSWIALFWAAVATQHALSRTVPSIMAFATVASGAIGCVVAGVLADRFGRTTTTMTAMVISGSCALVVGFAYRAAASPLILGAITLIWGVSIVADSAQFSACVTELSPPEYVGTALTVQTCLGFLLTVASIRAVPVWVAHWGWGSAFAPLALGPLFGTMAMFRLRADRYRVRLAGGHG
ncbi:MAG TPA: MFS transporter [Gemmatimonadaceae bacterium]|nr:MFS transporter [Gemmatimonadaceae bacterium]